MLFLPHPTLTINRLEIELTCLSRHVIKIIVLNQQNQHQLRQHQHVHGAEVVIENSNNSNSKAHPHHVHCLQIANLLEIETETEKEIARLLDWISAETTAVNEVPLGNAHLLVLLLLLQLKIVV